MTRPADTVVFVVSCFVALGLAIEAGYQYGFEQGQKVPRICAAVKGEQVVSSMADECTYANAYGRATRTRRAM